MLREFLDGFRRRDAVLHRDFLSARRNRVADQDPRRGNDAADDEPPHQRLSHLADARDPEDVLSGHAAPPRPADPVPSGRPFDDGNRFLGVIEPWSWLDSGWITSLEPWRSPRARTLGSFGMD